MYIMSFVSYSGVLAPWNIDGPEERAEHEAELDLANDMLRAHGLPLHTEPVDVPKLQHKSMWFMGLGHVIHLQYACCRMFAGESARTPGVDEDCQALMQPYRNGPAALSHLATQCAYGGIFLPMEFERPIPAFELVYGNIASTPRLISELTRLAPLIGVDLQNGVLPEKEIQRLQRDKRGQPFDSEQSGWFHLWETANHSFKYKSALWFSG